MKIKKSEKRKDFMNERIAIIKDFARKMGYEIIEQEYSHCSNGRPCYLIELGGTCDAEGDSYGWAWYMDTFEEV